MSSPLTGNWTKTLGNTTNSVVIETDNSQVKRITVLKNTKNNTFSGRYDKKHHSAQMTVAPDDFELYHDRVTENTPFSFTLAYNEEYAITSYVYDGVTIPSRASRSTASDSLGPNSGTVTAGAIGETDDEGASDELDKSKTGTDSK